jgi:large subunit ribosomal protein L5
MKGYKEQVEKTVVPELQKTLGLKHALAVPRVQKIIVTVGLNAGNKNPKLADIVTETLTRITGQKPVQTKARMSISGFKVRQGMVVGVMVTLRGKRMHDFLFKLVNVALPRIRDFRGMPTTLIDSTGNLTIGIREHLVFPEIHSDEVDALHGLQVTITTSAKTHDEGVALFRALGFPFIS